MSPVLSSLLDNISSRLFTTVLLCFLFCLPFLSRLYRLILKPPALRFLQSSSTYLIMHHKRKQKCSLIMKSQQQNQANDTNLMIMDRITLTPNETTDASPSAETRILIMELHVLTLHASCQISAVL